MENEIDTPAEQISSHTELRKMFADKLIKMMIDKGHYPAKPKGKADASKLADVAGVSRQMAYKYLNGEALPNSVALEKISAWLSCPAMWLVNNEPDHLNLNNKSIDEALCQAIFKKMEPQFIEDKLTADKLNLLVETFMQIYNYAVATGSDIDSKLKSAEQMIALLKKSHVVFK